MTISKNHQNKIESIEKERRKKMHSIEYVAKIVNVLNKTPDEVMRKVMEYKGSIVFGNKAAYKYLRQFSAKEIRMILTKEKENE